MEAGFDRRVLLAAVLAAGSLSCQEREGSNVEAQTPTEQKLVETAKTLESTRQKALGFLGVTPEIAKLLSHCEIFKADSLTAVVEEFKKVKKVIPLTFGGLDEYGASQIAMVSRLIGKINESRELQAIGSERAALWTRVFKSYYQLSSKAAVDLASVTMVYDWDLEQVLSRVDRTPLYQPLGISYNDMANLILIGRVNDSFQNTLNRFSLIAQRELSFNRAAIGTLAYFLGGKERAEVPIYKEAVERERLSANELPELNLSFSLNGKYTYEVFEMYKFAKRLPKVSPEQAGRLVLLSYLKNLKMSGNRSYQTADIIKTFLIINPL